MKRVIRRAVLDGAARLGVTRWLGARLAPGGLAILMYHAVTAHPLEVPDWCFVPLDEFRWQMEFLAQRCHVLPLEEALRRLHSSQPPDALDGPPAVAITFDDGYANNLSVALPVLRALGLPATIFLTTGFLGTREALWFCKLHAALSATRAPALEFEGARWDLGSATRRATASADLQARLKRRPHADLLAATGDLLTRLGIDPAAPLGIDSPYRLANADELRAGLASGLISYGAHTRDHTILALLGEDEQHGQIVGSLADVAALTGRPCQLFAYPNGRAEDYTAATRRILREARVPAAVTTRGGVNVPTTDPLQLGRYGIGCGTPRGLFEAQVHHLATRGRKA